MLAEMDHLVHAVEIERMDEPGTVRCASRGQEDACQRMVVRETGRHAEGGEDPPEEVEIGRNLGGQRNRPPGTDPNVSRAGLVGAVDP